MKFYWRLDNIWHAYAMLRDYYDSIFLFKRKLPFYFKSEVFNVRFKLNYFNN